MPCYFFRENGGAHYLVRKDKVLDFFFWSNNEALHSFGTDNNTRTAEETCLIISSEKISILFWRNNEAVDFFFKHKKVLGLQRKQANLPHNFFRKNKLFFSRNNEMLAIVLKEKIIPGWNKNLTLFRSDWGKVYSRLLQHTNEV